MRLHLEILVVRDGPLFGKIRGVLTHDSALTRQCNFCFTSILLRKWQSGYVFGLKPIYGGSIPSFLV